MQDDSKPSSQNPSISQSTNGCKRKKKTKQKVGQADYSQGTQSPQKDDSCLFSNNKYNEITGTCEWFQLKRLELETQKKSLSGIPINAQWKPPRIDQDRYQAQVDNTKHESGTQGSGGPHRQSLKRRKRAHSEELKEEYDQVRPHKTVTYQGHPLLTKEELSGEKVHKKVFSSEAVSKNEEQMQDYLELVDYIMKESNSSCNGIWLKGSSQHIENGMKLLHQYNYNYSLAKFHILYPTVMNIPNHKEEVMNSLSEKELESIVNDAIIDLKGCKNQEAEEAIANIRNVVSGRVTVEDLVYYQQVLKKLRIDMPLDIDQEIIKSREFSKLIKKKCGASTGGGVAAQIPMDKKMKMEELLQMQEEASNYKVITAEMNQLQDYVKKAKTWIEKSNTYRDQVLNVKNLQNIVQEARSIPVNFEQLMEEVKKRYHDAQNLVERIHQTFIKVNKTRTQIASDKQESHKGRGDKKKLDVSSHKSKNHSEDTYRSLLKEADALKITNSEVQKLRQHIEEAEQWKRRVVMFLEDEREQIERKEVFQILLRETALFKFELDLSKVVQKRFEFIDWKEKVIKVWKVMNAVDQPVGEEGMHVPQKVQLKNIQQLMQEGEKKDFSELPIPEVREVGEVCLKANKFEVDICQVLKDIKDKKEPLEMTRLLQLKKEGDELPVSIPEQEELNSKIKEVQEYDNQCKEYLENSNMNGQSSKLQPEQEGDRNGQERLKELLGLRAEITKLGVTNNTFKEFERMAKPILRWNHYSRHLIKSYHKTVEILLSQQDLLEQQEYESSSSDEEMVADGSNNQDQQAAQIKRGWRKEVPYEEFELLDFLIKQAQENLNILAETRNYDILVEIRKRVDTWLSKVEALEAVPSQQSERVVVEQLEKMISEHLPLPTMKVQKVQKQLRRERWLRKLYDLQHAEKVRLKQIESLAKESNHSDIQEDDHCKAEAEQLQESLSKSREWFAKQQKVDLNSQEEIAQLIDLGKSLKLNLVDYVELRNFHQDVMEWKNKTRRMLNNWKLKDFNYEAVRKHVELAALLDINDKELDLLNAIINMCAHWKSTARKILNSRPLTKLEHQIIMKPSATEDDNSQFSVILKKVEGENSYSLCEVTTPSVTKEKAIKKIQFFDNQVYCTCRRGDDGLVFMIGCDLCGEWFHGDCVGISKQEGSKVTKYLCIACARRKENFNPLLPPQTKAVQDDSGSGQSFDPSMYTAFTSERRASYQVVKTLIDDGQRYIPVYLEEMDELLDISEQVEEWLCRAAPLLQEGVDTAALEALPGWSYDERMQNSALREQEKKKQQDTDQSLHRLYLQSESFPVEVLEAEDVIGLLQLRDWYRDATKLLVNQQKTSKVGIKKQAKRLLAQADFLKAEKDQKLMPMVAQLQQLLTQQQQQQHSQSQLQSYSQPSQIGMSFEVDHLFESGGADYGEYVRLIENAERGNLVQTFEDRRRLEELRTLLSSYAQWLSQVRECLNNYKKTQTIEEFELLMIDGDKHFWMITSVEKQQYQQILNNYYGWVQQSQELLAQTVNPTFDTRTNHFYVSKIQELNQVYQDQFPFFSELASELLAKEQQLVTTTLRPKEEIMQVQQAAMSIEQGQLEASANNEGTLDFFK